MMLRRRVTHCLGLLALLAAADAAQGQAADSVWVNSRSGVYHCPGTEYFGRTTRGEYLSESVARERGFRPNGGRRCVAGIPVADSVAAAPVMPADLETACVVEQITDGDTVRCQGIGPIRLIGLDAPERGEEPYATAATSAMAALLTVGDTVQVEYDNDRRGSFGRVLAYLWHRGEMVNWRLVRSGWAIADPYPNTARYAGAFELAERAAKGEQRGLWYVDGLRCRVMSRMKQPCR